MRKEDVKSLKEGTKVVVYGITTTIKDSIMRKGYRSTESENEEDATICRGMNDYGIPYIILALDRLNPDEILWDSDCVEVDINPFPSFCKNDRYVELEDVLLPRKITELTEEELVDLYKHVVLGSLYLSDYNNDYGVPREEVCDEMENFEQSMYEEWGESYEEHLTAEEFAEYVECEI